MIITQYSAADATRWDDFVETSKNGTFLFMRNYMEYHADRFEDCSLLIADEQGRLVSLLPGNVKGEKFWSHLGLSYGGFLFQADVTAEEVLQVVDETLIYLKGIGIRKFYYRVMPTCYHLYPAEEDVYALWRHGAMLETCNLSSTIDLRSPMKPKVERRRRRGWQRAMKMHYEVREIQSVKRFWAIVERNLGEKYGVKPVHTESEMQLLKDRFPDQIRCFVSVWDDQIEACTVLYFTQQTVHAQYTHATAKGKRDGAQDLLYHEVIAYCKEYGYRYFEFGHSCEQEGRVLNANLIAQKEGFAARGMVYRILELDLI